MHKPEGARIPSHNRTQRAGKTFCSIATTFRRLFSSPGGRVLLFGALVIPLFRQTLPLLAGTPVKIKPLFDPSTFPKGWKFHSQDRKSKLDETWKIRKSEKADDSVLICTGKPLGYIRTEQPYQNFEFSMQWKYPMDANGNSGVLVYTQKEDRIWPRSIQVQLHQPLVGSIFPVGGAMSDNKFDTKDLKLPVDKWHTCVIVCKEGTVTVSINGEKLGSVTGCLPQKGFIALQSEGSEVHFRRIKLKPMK